MSVKFFNMTEADFLSNKLLYKFMPLEYALDTIDNQHLWFANPCEWPDPFESRFIQNTFKISGHDKTYPWKGRVFCMCMTEKSTSEAYWNTYSKQEIGVSLKYKRKELLQAFKDYCNRTGFMGFVGRVCYQRTNIITGPVSANPFMLNDDGSRITSLGTQEAKVKLLLLKREAFHYEEEIRFFIVKPSATKVKGIYFDYPAVPSIDMILGIILDPKLKEKTLALLKDTFVSKGFAPASKRVQQSLLYKSRGTEKINF
mgnify:CR=1 FL=1